MPNKIHQKLKKLAEEILEMEEPYDYQKVYDATLLLLESLILIKNTNGFKDNFRENLEKNLDQVGDFIRVKHKSETKRENSNDIEDLPHIVDTTKEIIKGIAETKTPEVDLLKENSKLLSFERKKETPVTEKEIKKSLNDKFS